MIKGKILFGVIILLSLQISAQETCEKLLQEGLYQKINIINRKSFSQDLKIYFQSEDFKSDIKKGSWGSVISIPIDGMPFSIGVNSNDEKFSEFKKKVEGSNNLNISTNDFVNISKSLPNSSLYDSYVRCKEIEADRFRTGLSQGKKIETEETVIFTFYYRPSSPKDKGPRVKSFMIEPQSALINSGGIKVGKRLPSFLMQVTCRRSQINEITFTLQTEKGYVSDNSGPTKSSRFETPIGTIIASYLSFDRFREAIGESTIWKTSSKWAPCDGREVLNSAFSIYSSSSTVPDLRGTFLRGLNTFDINPPSTVGPVSYNQKDIEDRAVGSFQQDELKSHKHTLNVFRHPFAWGSAQDGVTVGGYSNPQGAELTSDDNLSGGLETRPKNISVYYYIKIN